MSLFDRLKEGLRRTHQGFVGGLDGLFRRGTRVTPETLEEFLETLVGADLGYATATEVVERFRERLKTIPNADPLAVLREVLLEALAPVESLLVPGEQRPWVVLVAGVNGSGKTTTTAKLAHRWTTAGRRVAVAAADTFRAGAVEQLRVWAERTGSGFYSGQYGADPSGVVFDAIAGARARNEEILLVDTAGRLHTSVNLMEELKKVHRVAGKVMPGAPHEVLLVLDATIGQNSIQQARQFHQALGVTGLALTKLDGTAKGGIIVSIARELALPVKLIGVGEAAEDLQDFRAADFVDALFAD